jgi:hypothetical protein
LSEFVRKEDIMGEITVEEAKRRRPGLQVPEVTNIMPAHDDEQNIKPKVAIVTDYSLANWIAHNHGLDLMDWPGQKPDHISKEVFDQLKKILKKFLYNKNHPQFKII